MKAFAMAVLATVVIGVGSHFALNSLDLSSERVFTTQNVRQ